MIKDKWYLDANAEQDVVLTKWSNDLLNKGLSCIDKDDKYFVRYNETGDYTYINKPGFDPDESIYKDRTEISFDYFEDYILNKRVEIYDVSNLTKILKQYNIK